MKISWRMARRVGAVVCRAAVRAQERGSTAESTRKMAELLRKIYAEQDWKTDPNKDAERAKYLKEQLAAGPDIRTELKLREALAENLLRAGDSAGAVEQLETIRTECKEKGIVLKAGFEHDLRETLA